MTPLKEIYFNLLKLERLRLTLIYSSEDLGTNVRLYFQAQSIIFSPYIHVLHWSSSRMAGKQGYLAKMPVCHSKIRASW